MKPFRKTAIIVGVLYILGTVMGVLSVLVTQSILTAPDYLAQIAANENRMVTGALFVLTMGLALAMVPVLLFPILRKQNEVLAAGYLIFRGALETVTDIALVTCWLFLILISREFVASGAPAASALQSMGKVFLKGNDSISNVMVIVFSLDALMLYYMLYRSRLVPSWISVWGFIAILMHFSTAFMGFYGLIDSNFSTIQSLINLPILLQEMVMAVWLILKGFNPSALAAMPAKADSN
jgi:Domain of unknown function (DUF4386)